MAGRMTNVVEALSHKLVELNGSFAPQGTSAPLPNPIWALTGSNPSTNAGYWGPGITSIVRASAGVWTVTLSDSWFRCLFADASIRPADGAAAAAASVAQCCNVNVTGATVNSNAAKTLQITNTTIASSPALADISAATGAIVYFVLSVQNTSVV